MPPHRTRRCAEKTAGRASGDPRAGPHHAKRMKPAHVDKQAAKLIVNVRISETALDTGLLASESRCVGTSFWDEGKRSQQPWLTECSITNVCRHKKRGEEVLGVWKKGGKRLHKVKRALKRVSLRRTKGVEF
eukprot:scaffold64733_cov62-Phaeocystis_antarctica.AAC.6